MSREHPLAPHRLVIAVLVFALAAIVFLTVRGPAWWQRIYHPLAYADVIGASAADSGVDPYLVAALINAESGFDPAQVSEAGAVGLMQLMPETAAEIAGEAGVAQPADSAALAEPARNIDLGVRHLATLVKRYEDVVVALAAYNAGEGNIDRWIAESGADDILAAAYPETRRYVERVLRERDAYARLYPDAFAPGVADQSDAASGSGQ